MKLSILTNISFVTLLYALTILYFPYNNIPKDFKSYHNKYMFIVENSCDHVQYEDFKHLEIRFGDLSNYVNLKGEKQPLAGLAQSYNLWAVITIDQVFWNRATEDQKLSLIFHELTHVLFKYPDLKDPKDRSHFMYHSVNGLSKEFETYKQLVTLTGVLCKR